MPPCFDFKLLPADVDVDRRYFSFLLASTAFFLIYTSLRVMFLPPPVKPPDAPVAQQDGIEAAEIPEVQPGESSAAESDATSKPRPEQPEWLTLGSMDPKSGYWMLVTLNSRGGGVERIELTQRNEQGRFKYRRVDVQSGYFGYLAADPAAVDVGVRVNVVGPGTPADTAGLKRGDLIVSFNGKAINNYADLQAALNQTRPKKTVTVEVTRGSANESVSLQAKLTEHPMDLVRFAREGGEDEVVGNLDRLSCLLTVGKCGRKEIMPDQRSLPGVAAPEQFIWEITQQAADEASHSASMSVELSAGDLKSVGGKPLRLKRSYVMRPNSYALDMDLELQNLSETTQELAYRLEGVNGLTLEGWWYSNKISPNWSGSAARDVIVKTAAAGYRLISGFALQKRALDETGDADQTLFAPDGAAETRDLKYIGVDAQYFAVAYLPPENQSSLQSFRRAGASIVADAKRIPKNQERAVNVGFHLDGAVAEVPPSSSIKQSLRLFAGPKQPELLAEYGLDDTVYYGWFSWASSILGIVLHFFYAVLGNYAVAIVALTVLVRGLVFPLSRKAAVNAQRMQELAPEFKKISEKYKDDMEGRLKAQRELQKRVGFNPLAGCLPMFLQLPIFIGLYRLLSVDIELRQAAFGSWTTWSSNLAAPDMFTYWGDWLWDYLSGRGTGWLEPYFNILPIIVVALFLAQQKMFMPPATDEQTELTQKMMNFMTLFMGLFFFRVPAGLCVYFITSSLWGISERILVKKTLPQKPHFSPEILEGRVVRDTNVTTVSGVATASKPGAVPADTFLTRLAQKIRPEAPPPAPAPRDRKRPGKPGSGKQGPGKPGPGKPGSGTPESGKGDR